MNIVGVDYHPSFQQIAFMDQETGECGERELKHSDGEAEKFYRELKQRGISVRVGMEATGYSRWFERLLAELGFEVWPKTAELTAAVEHEAKKRPEVVQLMTHSGVGPITGLAYVLVIGTPERFPCGKQVGSYTGLIPCEDSSAGRQRLGKALTGPAFLDKPRNDSASRAPPSRLQPLE
jgi:transposase